MTTQTDYAKMTTTELNSINEMKNRLALHAHAQQQEGDEYTFNASTHRLKKLKLMSQCCEFSLPDDAENMDTFKFYIKSDTLELYYSELSEEFWHEDEDLDDFEEKLAGCCGKEKQMETIYLILSRD